MFLLLAYFLTPFVFLEQQEIMPTCVCRTEQETMQESNEPINVSFVFDFSKKSSIYITNKSANHDNSVRKLHPKYSRFLVNDGHSALRTL